MSLPASSFVATGEGVFCEDIEWKLNCDHCHSIFISKGFLYKVVDEPEDEGWAFEDGEIICDLCGEEKGSKKKDTK